MLTDDKVERLREAIIATVASPVIGSIEDYAWEAIFHHVKNIPLSDPALGRKKDLYDAVDTVSQTGWSLKSLQTNSLAVGNSFRFVIQRADIIKKGSQLGFSDLTLSASAEDLGLAIIRHWNDKIIASKTAQLVRNSYESILLKTIRGNQYLYCEYPLEPYEPDEFFWQRTNSGLQGNILGNPELIWYSSQKQLFRARKIPEQAIQINIDRIRLTCGQYFQTIIKAIESQIDQSKSS